MFLRLLKVGIFSLILLVLLWMLSGILERKESQTKIAPFLDRAEDVDVLFLGSSHVLSAVYPMELFSEYGITSYNLGSYNNTVPVSYWMMRCALDACTPELVVLDIDCIGQQEVLGSGSADVHTALDGFPLTWTKAQAIWDLMGDPEVMDDDGNRYADLKWEYLFPMLLYHSRWANLSADDFAPKQNQHLGAYMSVNVAQPAEYSIVADAADDAGPGFEYLRKIVQECRGRGIEVLLINAPYPAANDDDQRYSNAVYYVAEECGVDYIDFVYMDQIVDYSTDCYDAASHLNPSGARKVTDYLGEYMQAVYGLEDHRSDEAYAAWAEDYDAYVDEKIQMIREQNDLAAFLMLLHDQDFSVCVYVPEDCPVYGDEHMLRMLQNVGRRHLFEADTYDSVWADGLEPLEQLEAASYERSPYLFVIDRGAETCFEVKGCVDDRIDASFGSLQMESGVLYQLQQEGTQTVLFEADDLTSAVCVAVIDERTGDVAMVRKFNQ